MKRYIYFLITVGVLLCIAAFYREDISRKMVFAFSKHVIRERMEDKESVWFKYAEIDSFYEKNSYKYFLFVKSRPYRSEDVTLLNRDSTLILLSHSVGEGIPRLNNPTIRLPESVFPYLLDDNQDVQHCVVDSVVKDTMNSYRIRRCAVETGVKNHSKNTVFGM